jgi:ribonuclease P protein component
MKIPGINTERLASIFSVPSKLYHPNQCFTVKAVKNEAGDLNRFGIITGKKKISKSAVLRNRADRRIKAAIQTVYPDLKMKGIFVSDI